MRTASDCTVSTKIYCLWTITLNKLWIREIWWQNKEKCSGRQANCPPPLPRPYLAHQPSVVAVPATTVLWATLNLLSTNCTTMRCNHLAHQRPSTVEGKWFECCNKTSFSLYVHFITGGRAYSSMEQCISRRKHIPTHRCYGESVGLVLKFTTSFSFRISTNKKNLFIWNSMPKIGGHSEHCEIDMAEEEECTPEYRLSPFLHTGHLLFNYILRTISNLERKCMVGLDSFSGFCFVF